MDRTDSIYWKMRKIASLQFHWGLDIMKFDVKQVWNVSPCRLWPTFSTSAVSSAPPKFIVNSSCKKVLIDGMEAFCRLATVFAPKTGLHFFLPHPLFVSMHIHDRPKISPKGLTMNPKRIKEWAWKINRKWVTMAKNEPKWTPPTFFWYAQNRLKGSKTRIIWKSIWVRTQ